MATPHKDSTTKGGALQYQRLTPLGRAGLSALGLGLASPAPKAPAKPDSGPSYAAVTVQSESREGLCAGRGDVVNEAEGRM